MLLFELFAGFGLVVLMFLFTLLCFVLALDGLDTEVAKERGAGVIVAVNMYDDYLNSLEKSPESTEDIYKALFVSEFRKSLATGQSGAQLSAKISLKKNPLDFSSKRQAIQMGFEEGKRLADEIRSRYSE